MTDKHMSYFFVSRTEYSGYDCGGHRVMYVVVAHSAEEAKETLGKSNEWENETIVAVPVILPDISPRKSKPYVALEPDWRRNE